MKDHWICIARILRSHGLHGELRVDPVAKHWEGIDSSEPMRLVDRHGHVMMAQIESMRNQQTTVLVKFREIADRTMAERFTGGGIEIKESKLADLPADEYYVKDIIGLTVVNEAGEKLGRITQVLEMPANDVYEVDIAGEKKLIPAVAEFVRHIDLERKQMIIRVIPGLLDSHEDVAP